MANLNTGRVNAELYGFLTWRLMDGFVPNYMTLSNWLLLLRVFFSYIMTPSICFCPLEDENLNLDIFLNFVVQIIKQLEKESIKWTEEENGRTIWIRLDVIDPKRLSFSRKMSERNKSSRRGELKRRPWQMLLLLLSIRALRWTFLLWEVDKRF